MRGDRRIRGENVNGWTGGTLTSWHPTPASLPGCGWETEPKGRTKDQPLCDQERSVPGSFKTALNPLCGHPAPRTSPAPQAPACSAPCGHQQWKTEELTPKFPGQQGLQQSSSGAGAEKLLLLERQSPGLAALSHCRDSQEIQPLQPGKAWGQLGDRDSFLLPGRSPALTPQGLAPLKRASPWLSGRGRRWQPVPGALRSRSTGR